jgi:2-iminobutanoate/2-iminopropanoate deaminase
MGCGCLFFQSVDLELIHRQAVSVGGTLYVSGCIGLKPDDGVMVSEDVEGQTVQVMENMKAVVEAGGMHMSDVVKCTILLQHMSDFPKVNTIYATCTSF